MNKKQIFLMFSFLITAHGISVCTPLSEFIETLGQTITRIGQNFSACKEFVKKAAVPTLAGISAFSAIRCASSCFIPETRKVVKDALKKTSSISTTYNFGNAHRWATFGLLSALAAGYCYHCFQQAS